MQQIKQVGYGFAAMTSGTFLLVTAFWMLSGYLTLWLGIPLFLLLTAPFVVYIAKKVKQISQATPIQTRVNQAKGFLMALPGAGLACWFFDVLSTVFVIDIIQRGTEQNPLGWPYSAPVALAYYIPVIVIVHFLLYRVKSKKSFYAAVAISIATLMLGAASFFASLSNFVFTLTSAPASPNSVILGVWAFIAAALAVTNAVAVKSTKNACEHASLQNKPATPQL
ncbi:MAG: hypothetical protein ACQCN4_12760 [Candidatus Bathyarchaeia archaeon]|jgi:hypothetical protein